MLVPRVACRISSRGSELAHARTRRARTHARALARALSLPPLARQQSGDFSRMVQKHMQRGEWKAAVQVLERLPHAQLALVYRYSSVLIRQLPYDVAKVRARVNASPSFSLFSRSLIFCLVCSPPQVWMRMGRKLDPSKLVPALAQYATRPTRRTRSRRGTDGENVEDDDCALMYLRFVVESGFGDRSIHNFLVALLARTEIDEGPLLAYLDSYGATLEKCGRSESAQLEQSRYVPALRVCSSTSFFFFVFAHLFFYLPSHRFDPHYALRCCLDGNKAKSAVLIYQQLGRREDAVKQALAHDLLSLARQSCADALAALSLLGPQLAEEGERAEGEDTSASCKALWMHLAKYCCRKAGEQGGSSEEQELRKRAVDQIESILSDSDGLVQVRHQNKTTHERFCAHSPARQLDSVFAARVSGGCT